MQRRLLFLAGFLAVLCGCLAAKQAQAQTFGSWSVGSWSGGGHSATATAGAVGGLTGVGALTYGGALASFSPVPVQGFGMTAANTPGVVLQLALSPGLAGSMRLLLDNVAIGLGYNYQLLAFDAANSPVSLAGVTSLLTDVSNPIYTDTLTLDGLTGAFGLTNQPGGDNLNTATTLFTGFHPSIRTLRITTNGTPGGDSMDVGIQVVGGTAPEPFPVVLLLLGGSSLVVLRRRRREKH